LVRVTTRFYAFLRESVGKEHETLELDEGATVSDFLRVIGERYRDALGRLVFEEGARLRKGFAIALNGVSIRPEAWAETRLNDGDVIVILPPIAGGLSRMRAA